MKLHQYLGLKESVISRLRIFNRDVDEDILSFIDYKRLQLSSELEFSDTVNVVRTYFMDIWTQLYQIYLDCNRSGISFETHADYSNILHKLSFFEYHGVGLGYAKAHNHCKGWELSSIKVLAKRLYIVIGLWHGGLYDDSIKNAFLGNMTHTASTIKGVGPDCVSDMIALVLKKEIFEYSARKTAELITQGVQPSVITKDFPCCGNTYTLFEKYPGYPVILLPITSVVEIADAEKRVMEIIYQFLLHNNSIVGDKGIDEYLGIDAVQKTIDHKNADKERKFKKPNQNTVSQTNIKKHIISLGDEELSKILPFIKFN